MVTRNAVHHLLTYGFENDTVQDFIEEYLKPLVEYIDKMRDDKQYYFNDENGCFMRGGDLVYEASRQQLKNGLLMINRLFTAEMEHRPEIGDGGFYERCDEIALELRGFIGFQNAFEVTRYVQISGYPLITQENFRRLYPNALMPKTVDVRLEEIPLDAIVKARYLEYQKPLPAFDWNNEEEVQAADRVIKSKLEALKKVLRSKQRGRFPYVSEETIDEIAKKEVNRIRRFRNGLTFTGIQLLLHPIMVNSGQVQEVPAIQRTYQDVQNEIASRLVNLPQFTARAKVAMDNGTAEHIIKTLMPEYGIGRKELQQRLEHIQAQNARTGYLRSREKVDKEIRLRQEKCSNSQHDEPPISRREPR